MSDRAFIRNYLTDLSKIKCELCHLMNEEDAHPDIIAASLPDAVTQIEKELIEK